MNIEYVEAFTEACVSIVEEVSGIRLVKESSTLLETKDVSLLDLVVLVGLTGRDEGRLVVDMEQQFGLQIISAMNSQNNVQNLDEIGESTLTELVNLIVGRAITNLYKKGFEIESSPPTLMKGVSMSASFHRSEICLISFQNNPGVLRINLALKQG